MNQLKKRTSKIQEIRKKTELREFIKESAGWFNCIVQKTDHGIGRFHAGGRFKNILNASEFEKAPLYFLDIDSNKTFFTQLEELFFNAPMLENVSFGDNENAKYTESAFGVKNGYMSIEVGFGTENAFYSTIVYYDCKNIYNSLQVTNGCNNIYFGKFVVSSSNIFYSKYIQNSNELWFSSNCIGCQECIACDGLTNKKYAINNTVYEKEEYFRLKPIVLEKLLSDDIGSYKKVNNSGAIVSSPGCTGSGVFSCSDIENGYNIARIHSGRNVLFGDGAESSRDYFDAFHVGDNCTDFYGVSCCGINNVGIYCSVWVIQSTNIFYSYHMDSCSYCLGCTGLKNKSYCIFNKQYEKEERYERVNEIFTTMEKEGTFGSFLPGSINPFYFNDTAACLIDTNFSRDEIIKEGYLWRNEIIAVDIPEQEEIIETTSFDSYQTVINGRYSIDPSIVNKVIRDNEGNVYRIVKTEYDFLNKYGLPLPTTHWLERWKSNFMI